MRDRPAVRYGLAGSAFLNRFSDALESLWLTPIRVLAIAYVQENAGCDQSSLGEVLGIGRASAMLLVDKLEALDYVERRPGVDRRSNALFVTETGGMAFTKALEFEVALANEIFGWMNEEQYSSFFDLIDEISKRTREVNLEKIPAY